MSKYSYTIWPSMSDNQISKEIGNFIKHHRIEQNKSQETVAASAGISRSTLSLLERGESVTLSTLIRVIRVLELWQVMDAFQIEKQISPLAITIKDQQKRFRVRNSPANDKSESEW